MMHDRQTIRHYTVQCKDVHTFLWKYYHTEARVKYSYVYCLYIKEYLSRSYIPDMHVRLYYSGYAYWFIWLSSYKLILEYEYTWLSLSRSSCAFPVLGSVPPPLLHALPLSDLPPLLHVRWLAQLCLLPALHPHVCISDPRRSSGHIDEYSLLGLELPLRLPS